MTICYPETMSERDLVYFQVRLPTELHGRLKALAERDDRSLHWEALRIFRLGLDAAEQSRPQ